MGGPGKPVDLELTIISAKDLKNVNWRYGDLRPYAVAWVDPDFKTSTKVDQGGDTNPCWNENLIIPLTKPLQDAELQIDIVHEKPSEMTKPLVGTARIALTEVLDEVGFDENFQRTLKLKRPSGRPQGKLEVAIRLREKKWAEPQYPPPGAYPQPYGTRDYVAPPQPYGTRDYVAPPPQGYPANYPPYRSEWYPYGNNPNPNPPPPSGYYNPSGPPSYGGSYSQPGSQGAYGVGNYYDQGSSGYGGSAPVNENPKSSKFGVGTGLAVGAVAGVLGGVALVEGAEYLEDKISDEAAEKVEEDLAAEEYYDGDDF